MGISRRRMLMAASSMRAVTEEKAAAYAICRDSQYGGGYLYGSTDNGNNWTQLTSYKDVISCSTDITGSVIYLRLFQKAIYKRLVDGTEYSGSKTVFTGVSDAIAVSSGSEIIYCVNGSSMYRNQGLSGGTTKVQITSDSVTFNRVACSEDGKNVLAGTSTGVLYYSTNYGNSWGETATSQSSGVINDNIGMSNDGQVCVVGKADGMFLSTTGPQNMVKYWSRAINAVSVSGDGKCIIAACNSESKIYVSFDKGNSWNTISNNDSIYNICCSYLGENSVCNYKGYGLYTLSGWGTSMKKVDTFNSIIDLKINRWRAF